MSAASPCLHHSAGVRRGGAPGSGVHDRVVYKKNGELTHYGAATAQWCISSHFFIHHTVVYTTSGGASTTDPSTVVYTWTRLRLVTHIQQLRAGGSFVSPLVSTVPGEVEDCVPVSQDRVLQGRLDPPSHAHYAGGVSPVGISFRGWE